MRELLLNWYRVNNGNPLDDQRFYDIVIESVDNKIDQSTFEDVLREVKENISDEEIEEIVFRYEDLHCFLKYFNSK